MTLHIFDGARTSEDLVPRTNVVSRQGPSHLQEAFKSLQGSLDDPLPLKTGHHRLETILKPY